jgi:hypothetical protein
MRSDWIVSQIWDQAGQLEETGEYRMGMVRVVCFHIRSSGGGSTHLSRLRTDRLALVSKLNYVLTHMRFTGSHKLSTFDGHRVGWYPTILTECTWDTMWPPTDACRGIAWKTCTRVRWTRLDSLIAVVNYCHLWCLHDSGVSYCQVVPLQGVNWFESPRHSLIWVILVCCCHSIVMQLHFVMLIMRMMLTTL